MNVGIGIAQVVGRMAGHERGALGIDCRGLRSESASFVHERSDTPNGPASDRAIDDGGRLKKMMMAAAASDPIKCSRSNDGSGRGTTAASTADG